MAAFEEGRDEAATAALTAPAGTGSAAGAGPSSPTACACATTSAHIAGTSLPAERLGCRQHGQAYGDDSFFCYVQAPSSCREAAVSSSYPGARGPAGGWRLVAVCSHQVAAAHSLQLGPAALHPLTHACATTTH